MIIKTVIILVLLVYFGGGLGLLILQRKFIYSPTPYSPVEGLEEMDVSSAGHRLRGYIANAGKPEAVLYFGGNAENVAPKLAELAAHLEDFTLIGFDYRGYGGSEGAPSERGFYEDALNLLDRFANDYENVSVIGRSLGSGVATYVASRRQVHRLVLVTPFDSIADLAARRHPYYPVRWLLRDRFDSLSRAKQITTPTLVLIAEHDDIVPHQHTERLLSALVNCPREVHYLSGTGHNSMGTSPSYASVMMEFLTVR